MKNALALGLLLAALTAPWPAAAQTTYKCLSPPGKTVYSDAPCPSDAKGSTVRTDQNTLPALQQPARAALVADCTPDPTPVDENMIQCKFPWYSAGDDKGKALSADAKIECLQNVAAKRACLPVHPSTEAYQLWKDHHDQMVVKRRPRTMNCVPAGYGLSCN